MVPAYVAARELERRRALRIAEEAARQLPLHLDDTPPMPPEDTPAPLPEWATNY